MGNLRTQCSLNDTSGLRKLILENPFEADKDTAMEWLESEHEEKPVRADAPSEERKGPEPGNIRDAALKELFS